MSRQPILVSDILRRNTIPVYDVQVADGGLVARLNGHKRGDVVVTVTGVPKSFRFCIPAQHVIDNAPYGRPTDEGVKILAREYAEKWCREKGYI